MKIEFSPIVKSVHNGAPSYFAISAMVVTAVIGVLAAKGIIGLAIAGPAIAGLSGFALLANGYAVSKDSGNFKKLIPFFLATIACIVVGGLGGANILAASTMGWTIFGCSLASLLMGSFSCNDWNYQLSLHNK